MKTNVVDVYNLVVVLWFFGTCGLLESFDCKGVFRLALNRYYLPYFIFYTGTLSSLRNNLATVTYVN